MYYYFNNIYTSQTGEKIDLAGYVCLNGRFNDMARSWIQKFSVAREISLLEPHII